jgi:precorrin-4 C11-methyltransferase/precorrin-2 C(20)-methyltransferase
MSILYGVGAGPGDPELLTLKAVRLIREADVVFCPAGRPGRARTIAARHLLGKRVVELDMEMRGDRERAPRAAALRVAGELGAGTGVYLTEGDSSLYSTFALLARSLAVVAPGIELRAVAGVSAVTAAAAAAGFTLGLGDESLAVLPASVPPALLEDVLETFDTTVLLKPSMAGDLGDRLRRLDLLQGSVLVHEASGGEERVLRGEAAAGERPPYFSTWLVRAGSAARDRGRVHFVGAGPGGARHLTRRALGLLRRADLVVAADSLVAPEVTGLARGRLVASSDLPLEEMLPPMIEAAGRGELVVRLHSGDPSLYGATSEQMARLRAAGCPYDVVPGVSSVFAAAAALGVELTEPGGSQTVVLTRQGNRVPTPERERLRELARHRSTLAIFLSAAAAADVERELLEAGLDPETPAAIAYRVSWPDEVVERTTVAGIAESVRRLGFRRHTLILVGDALQPGSGRSRLYDSGHAHVLRRRSAASAPALPRPPALVTVTAPGERLARRLVRAMPGARVVTGGRELPELFREGTPIVAFMAVGAAVRLLAPVLQDKRSEPPVVAVDDAGRYAVSLVGGRAAGGNRLTAYVASVLGAEAVVTTAAERLGLPALDEALAEAGWRLEEPRALAQLEAAVVNGEPLGFHGVGLGPPAGFDFRRVRSLAAGSRYAAGLAVSDRVLERLPEGWALARPRRLVIGFGCSTAATPEEAEEMALEALHEAGLAAAGVRRVATVDRRLEHRAARHLSELLGAELVAFTPGELDAVPVPNPSPCVRAAVGSASVAEAAALLGSGGRLLLPKRAGRAVTVALAEAPG